jgi:hypothetical protein
MNEVEIEAAVSELASVPYDVVEFPFQFLAAFDKKEPTLRLITANVQGLGNRFDSVPTGLLSMGVLG